MAIKKVGIIGCGTMGAGIAQAIVQNNYEVVVHESEQKILDHGLAKIQKALDRLEQKKLVNKREHQTLPQALSGTIELGDLSDCDLVIEAVFENIKVKQKLFQALDRICKNQTLFASNTSSLSITQMASFTDRQDQFVGLHFFNPVPVMPLVEVVKTISTRPEVLKRVLDFVQSLGKVAVVAMDNAGFIVNFLLTPFMLDAMQAAATGTASVRDIDTAMKLGCNHPMGPLMLADFIGLDLVYNASNTMFDEYKERRYAPPPVLKKMVLSRNLGQKTGRGFYDWSDLKNPIPLTIGI